MSPISTNAQMESVKGFSDDTMYIEKYIEKPRHIEFQIMADKHGNVVHLGERGLLHPETPSEGCWRNPPARPSPTR